MKNDGCVHFGDDTPLGKEFEAMYLGNEINRTVNIKNTKCSIRWPMSEEPGLS